jgi:SAM-dependent methyltransferase
MFDRVEEYDAELARGLALSGEGKAFFQRGRLADLRGQLPPGFAPRQILDFGCGLGDTAALLAEAFPAARVVGVEASAPSLDHARRHHASDRIGFASVAEVVGPRRFDLAYTNGVFHHIPEPERHAAARLVATALRPGGFFAFFENSPYNPGTRLIMRRIPFDRDARLLTPREARRLLEAAGFVCSAPPRFLFVFPRFARFLRPLERRLVHWPLGGQYWLLARSPGEPQAGEAAGAW